MDELTERDFAELAYYVCRGCGHVETRQRLVEPASRCENCGRRGPWTTYDQDEAEDASQEIIGAGKGVS